MKYEGKRVYGKTRLELAKLEYGFDKGGAFICYPPWDGEAVYASKHNIEENAYGEITVSPSILVRSYDDLDVIEWHGYLEMGIWRDSN
jgi:hypothetical protein